MADPPVVRHDVPGVIDARACAAATVSGIVMLEVINPCVSVLYPLLIAGGNREHPHVDDVAPHDPS